MTEPRDHPDDPFRDPELDAALETQGPLPDQVARRLIERGNARLEAGEHGAAAADFARVVGHPDANLTGAAVLGTGNVLYRVDAEDRAKAAWESVTRLPENASTYQAWRNLAGVHVRAGELREAIEAYRQADRRAPAEDKPEIAARLGWLAKETGNAGAASRYFAQSRGSSGILVTYVVLALTAAVSIAAFGSSSLTAALLLDPFWIQHGQLYRLLTVTLVHGGYLHLFLNLYALWIVGPVLESIWGKRLFLLFYVLTAIGGSTGSFLFSHAASVGASGAIFGLVGVILAGTRAHHPVLDRRARGIVPQLGMFVIINLVFGFVTQVGGLNIDNAAHVGGLLTGLWLGFVVPPGKAPTLRSAMQHPTGAETATRSPLLVAAGVIGLIGLLAGALAAGGATL
ncbi:MAG TPA: rhomboid family intramembrane serine protease [Candidatus Limnocylindrales bacterium]|jgi:rhomboid protease GluP|nr:rhomboid family intramembrane serine protease [Candidatus Limnocylindrales bacterium]